MKRYGWRTAAISAATLISIAGAGMESAQADGGAALTVRGLMARSLIASLEMKSVHMRGSANVTIAELNKRVSASIKETAFFRGDFAAGTTPAFHGRGQLRGPGSVQGFKFVGNESQVASKVGASPWTCVNASDVSTSTSPSMLPPAELKALRYYGRSLARKVRYADFGSTVYNGKPSWHVQARLATKLNLAPLLAVYIKEVSASKTTSAHQKRLMDVLKLPTPWVILKANVWINQLNYTIQKVTIFGKLRVSDAKIKIMFGDMFTHYGEAVKATLPGHCSDPLTSP